MRTIKPYGYSEINDETYNVEYYFPKKTLTVANHLNNPKLKQRLFTSIVDSLIKKVKMPEPNEELSAALHLCLFYSDNSPYKNSTTLKDINDFLGCEFDKNFINSINNYKKACDFYKKKLTYKPNFFKGDKIPADSKLDKIIQIVHAQYEKKLNSIKGSIANSKSPFTQDFNQTMYQYCFEYYLEQGKIPDFSDLNYPLKKLIDQINQYIKDEKNRYGQWIKENPDKNKKQYQKQHPHYKLIASEISAINKDTQSHSRVKNDQDTYDPNNKDNRLYFYKMLVKEAIKLYFPNTLAAKKRSLHKLDLLSIKDIQKKIEYKIRNKLISQFIRMGKFIFYMAEGQSELDYDVAQTAVKSTYFDSQKQHEIKQKESFVRKNQAAIAFASMSLKNIMDKDDEASQDILSGKFEEKDKNFDHEVFRLFYGTAFDISDAKPILKHVRNYVTDLRNNLFHFKKIELQQIYEKSIDDEAIKEIINKYINQANNQYQTLIKKELEALKIHQSTWDGSNQVLLTEYFQQNTNGLILPSFQKLLQRAENIKNNKSLPKPKDLITNINDTENLRHALFKRIYESGFTNWFVNQKDYYQSWIDAAMDRTKEASKKLSKLEEEQIKISRIPKFDHENIQKYFALISKLIAMENSIQQKNNRYQQDQDQARKNSNFIHDFVKDFYILAFQAYLRDKGLQELYKIKVDEGKSQLGFEKWKVNQNLNSIICRTYKQDIPEKDYLFYLYLHLLNGDHLNHLSMQLVKTATLTNKNETLATIKHYQNIVNFYLKIKDAQLMNISINDNLWQDFYAEKINHNNVNFSMQASIIELNRFIGLNKLKAMLKSSELLANQKEVNALSGGNLKTDIERKHKELAELHKKSLDDKKSNNQQDSSFTLENLKDYRDNMNNIEFYKHINKKITCQYPIKLHQLILAIAGRLVGYVNLFERDLYFYLVAVNYLCQGDALQKKDDLIDKEKRKNKEYKDRQRVELWKYVRNNTESQNLKQALAFFEQSFGDVGFNKIIGYRANIMHFNYLIQSNKAVNFTSFINDLRKLTSYDRKLKNAVSKSIMNILDQNGIEVKFEMDKHQLELLNIQAKEIEHLKHLKLQGENKIIIKTEHDDYIALVKQLFEEIKTKEETSKAEAEATV